MRGGEEGTPAREPGLGGGGAVVCTESCGTWSACSGNKRSHQPVHFQNECCGQRGPLTCSF